MAWICPSAAGGQRFCEGSGGGGSPVGGGGHGKPEVSKGVIVIVSVQRTEYENTTDIHLKFACKISMHGLQYVDDTARTGLMELPLGHPNTEQLCSRS